MTNENPMAFDRMFRENSRVSISMLRGYKKVYFLYYACYKMAWENSCYKFKGDWKCKKKFALKNLEELVGEISGLREIMIA